MGLLGAKKLGFWTVEAHFWPSQAKFDNFKEGLVVSELYLGKG